MTRIVFVLLFLLSSLLTGREFFHADGDWIAQGVQAVEREIRRAETLETGLPREQLSQPPKFSGSPYVELNSNIPFFHGENPLPEGYESYSPLDDLGRCGPAEANLSPSLMPTGKREPIGMIKPSGWHTVRYDDVIEKKYLYNRCHLIGFQLAGENANERNLITGTRYLNVEGMLPFENRLSHYVKTSGNHVRYCVTPDFREGELVARGVRLEAESVEDKGKGISFNVYCYNVQPGIEIDYKTGNSRLKTDSWEGVK